MLTDMDLDSTLDIKGDILSYRSTGDGTTVFRYVGETVDFLFDDTRCLYRLKDFIIDLSMSVYETGFQS